MCIRDSGTHWVCYFKRKNKVNYFDNFGNLRPPIELINYFYSSNPVSYTHLDVYKRQELNVTFYVKIVFTGTDVPVFAL